MDICIYVHFYCIHENLSLTTTANQVAFLVLEKLVASGLKRPTDMKRYLIHFLK